TQGDAQSELEFHNQSPLLDLLKGGFVSEGQPTAISSAHVAVAIDHALAIDVAGVLLLGRYVGVAQAELVLLAVGHLGAHRPGQSALAPATGAGGVALQAIV